MSRVGSRRADPRTPVQHTKYGGGPRQQQEDQSSKRAHSGQRTPSSANRNTPRGRPPSTSPIAMSGSMGTPSSHLKSRGGAPVVNYDNTSSGAANTTPTDALSVVECIEGATIGPYTVQQRLYEAPPSEGSYWSLLASHNTNRTLHMIKAIPLKAIHLHPKLRLQIEREVTVMRYCAHQHILQLDGVHYNSTHMFVVTRYCEGGELFELLESSNQRVVKSGGDAGLPMPILKRVFTELLEAIDWLHSHRIAHRDIKLEHVFLDADNCVRLGGLAMAAAMLPDADTHLLAVCCGSKHYACPEVVDGLEYHGELADAWSCGVLLFALATGSLPFVADVAIQAERGHVAADVHLFELIRNSQEHLATHPAWGHRYRDPQNLVRDLIVHMLHPDPNERLSVREALEHPFVVARSDHQDTDETSMLAPTETSMATSTGEGGGYHQQVGRSPVPEAPGTKQQQQRQQQQSHSKRM